MEFAQYANTEMIAMLSVLDDFEKRAIKEIAKTQNQTWKA